MKKAAERVKEVKDTSHETIYGGLCHSFPVMVRQCGLAQAVAFSEAKSEDKNKDRKNAHKRLLDDVTSLLGDKPIIELDSMDYLIATRRVLSAWVYYKRFAESILKVPSGEQGDQNDEIS